MSSRLLLVPAAGRSVRMGGLLKELLPLGTRAVADGSRGMPVPVLRHVLEAGLAAGVDEVAIVTSSAKAATLMEVVDSFDLGLPVAYVFQREAGGLGAALSCAAPQIRKHRVTLLHMPDVLMSPSEASAQALSRVADGKAAAVTLHRVAQPERFGVALFEGERLIGFVDKPSDAPTSWIWSAVAFDYSFLRFVDEVRPATGDWGLTEALDAATRSGVMAHVLVHDGWFHDVGTYDGYLAALDAVHRSGRR
jgi:glucose-1-phosphate thymidylyltransferase